MKKNDWLPGFVIGLVVVVAEVGYLAHFTGVDKTVSNQIQQKAAIILASE
ncbi:MAG: hypothetical protein ACFBSF_14230 [Leptolyngbyaceae cyanobacterium]